jgi:hypothetical protein
VNRVDSWGRAQVLLCRSGLWRESIRRRGECAVEPAQWYVVRGMVSRRIWSGWSQQRLIAIAATTSGNQALTMTATSKMRWSRARRRRQTIDAMDARDVVC